jgi:hypothetical protein
VSRTSFFLALAEDHRDEAIKVIARVVDTAQTQAGKQVPRGAPPAMFFRAGEGRNATYGTLARLCEKHAVTWEEVDHAMNVKNRIVRG